MPADARTVDLLASAESSRGRTDAHPALLRRVFDSLTARRLARTLAGVHFGGVSPERGATNQHGATPRPEGQWPKNK